MKVTKGTHGCVGAVSVSWSLSGLLDAAAYSEARVRGHGEMLHSGYEFNHVIHGELRSAKTT